MLFNTALYLVVVNPSNIEIQLTSRRTRSVSVTKINQLMAYREITYIYCHNHAKATDATSNKTQRYLLLRRVLHITATKIKGVIPTSHKFLNKTVNSEKRLLYIDVDLVTYSFILVVFSARSSLYVSPSR
jgi:uncharacterized metal-binding protein